MSNLSRREFLIVGFTGLVGLAGCTSKAVSEIVDLATTTQTPTSTATIQPTSTRMPPTKTPTATATPGFQPTLADLIVEARKVADIRIKVADMERENPLFKEQIKTVQKVLNNNLASLPEDRFIRVGKNPPQIGSMYGAISIEAETPVNPFGVVISGDRPVVFLPFEDSKRKGTLPFALGDVKDLPPYYYDDERLAWSSEKLLNDLRDWQEKVKRGSKRGIFATSGLQTRGMPPSLDSSFCARMGLIQGQNAINFEEALRKCIIDPKHEMEWEAIENGTVGIIVGLQKS